MILARNQEIVAIELEKAGVLQNPGSWRDVQPAQIGKSISDLCHDYDRRLAQSERGRTLIDGQGAQRVIAAMRRRDSQTTSDKISLRRARPQDVEDLWRLANDATVRQNSFHPEAVPFADHSVWFQQRLESPDSRIWLIELNGVLVAQIRYDRSSDGAAEIDFAVASDLRGNGLGTRALIATRQLACEELGVDRVRGVVLDSNPSSARAFLKADFQPSAKIEIDQKPCSVFEWQRPAEGTED
ncbi:MAG TPA: bifunctional UDP-2,4-diacetamido-2,4,6-trideoxy-beta-L-altropyranose hydrolase/GNAT family N-acetyltransferase, partial [Pyrinomonadaceae bacterium]|jgi:RimJ/RimL family protein N-acetyltransferase|nr:bifunctional UDP-2,4-diacetamido-2,4,6-trideoxy-beta-L-altropyranose hydrolase/GNAT family N-acetyltransferase [Pyrinomonadaceae bacterium]